MLPTCIIPASTCLDPNHKINKVVPFIKNIMTGIIIAMALDVNKPTFVISILALSNFSSSTFSLLKARITSIPSKSSRTTEFNLSVNFCMILNLGMTTIKTTMTTDKINTTQRAMIHVILASLLITCNKAPIPMIGAYTTIRNIITKAIWTC